jgi:hypothetical protein
MPQAFKDEQEQKNVATFSRRLYGPIDADLLHDSFETKTTKLAK